MALGARFPATQPAALHSTLLFPVDPPGNTTALTEAQDIYCALFDTFPTSTVQHHDDLGTSPIDDPHTCWHPPEPGTGLYFAAPICEPNLSWCAPSSTIHACMRLHASSAGAVKCSATAACSTVGT